VTKGCWEGFILISLHKGKTVAEQYPFTIESQNCEVSDRLESGLRYLLRNAEDAIIQKRDDESDQEIILDLILEGQRYLLIRTTVPTKQIDLSPREQEIAQLIMKGFPNKAIALTLGISPCTVATYMQRIFNKVGVNSRVEVVAKLLQTGIM
jgi:DNA-binding NarL/FixJ family response regulator